MSPDETNNRAAPISLLAIGKFDDNNDNQIEIRTYCFFFKKWTRVSRINLTARFNGRFSVDNAHAFFLSKNGQDVSFFILILEALKKIFMYLYFCIFRFTN